LLDWNIKVDRIKVILILLVHVSAVRETNSKPTTWIDLDATENINRIVVESIWSVASNVTG
jgi:hypothetical protein